MMKNDRFDRALHLVALMAVGGDDVQYFAGNAVLVSQRDAAERIPHLLTECALNHVARPVLVVLQWFAHIGQERTSDEIVTLNWNAAAKRILQYVRDGDALQGAGVEMLDKSHVDVAGQKGKLDRAKFVEG